MEAAEDSMTSHSPMRGQHLARVYLKAAASHISLSILLQVLSEILEKLALGRFIVKINHRALLDGMMSLCGVPADKFRTICSAIDKLDKEPWEAVRREMVEEKGLDPEVSLPASGISIGIAHCIRGVLANI